MHPIDRLGQPGAIAVVVLLILAFVSDWTRATLARLAVTEADTRSWRARGAWLETLWLDVERLEVR